MYEQFMYVEKPCQCTLYADIIKKKPCRGAPWRMLCSRGLIDFNLKSRLCGHLLTISFLEFKISRGFARAMLVFPERQVSQNLVPALYGTALVLILHEMSFIFPPEIFLLRYFNH